MCFVLEGTKGFAKREEKIKNIAMALFLKVILTSFEQHRFLSWVKNH